MDVYRKPATAEWYYDSAQRVDTVQILKDPWTGALDISFDATKDKQGDRHTEMKIRLSEQDAENLFAGLQRGRLAEKRALARKNTELEKELGAAVKAIKKLLEKLDEEWAETESESPEEKRIDTLREPLKKLFEKNRGWKWRY